MRVVRARGKGMGWMESRAAHALSSFFSAMISFFASKMYLNAFEIGVKPAGGALKGTFN